MPCGMRHAACSFSMGSDGMQHRLHAQGCTGSAPVPPSRLLPGRAQGRSRSRARSMCTRAACHAACTSRIVSKMMHARCACVTATAGGSVPRFLRTAEIGGHQIARRRASAHATRHENEITCMKNHAKLSLGYAACTCACGCATGAQESLCASCRWTRFSSVE